MILSKGRARCLEINLLLGVLNGKTPAQKLRISKLERNRWRTHPYAKYKLCALCFPRKAVAFARTYSLGLGACIVKVLAGTGQQSRPQSLPQKALGITVFVDNHSGPSLARSLVTQGGTTEKPL